MKSLSQHLLVERISFAKWKPWRGPAFCCTAFSLSRLFKSDIRCTTTNIRSLIMRRASIQCIAGSFSDGCTVEMNTGQVTNEMWLRFPWANTPAVRRDGGKSFQNIKLQLHSSNLNPSCYCRWVLRSGMGCCEWVSVVLPSLMARKCLCWRN